jgi:hypothetical protein
MRFYKVTLVLLTSLFLTNCEQKITIKNHKYTSINPVSYTDVIFKSSRDTVFVSTFNGKIYEVSKDKDNRKLIASIADEIYDLAYNRKENEIYAATLNSGVVVINELTGEIKRTLPIKQTWAYQLCYNEENGILATFDFKGNHYVWKILDKDYKLLKTPNRTHNMRPKHITNSGDIYFDGQGKIITWNYITKDIKQSKIRGNIADIDDEKNILLTSNKEFIYYNPNSESIAHKKKHPNWPIQHPEKDTIINIPLNLEIMSGVLTNSSIYTYGLDKSIRKWDKSTGDLTQTYVKHKASISGININENKNQFVSIDLLGKIHFWDIEETAANNT